MPSVDPAFVKASVVDLRNRRSAPPQNAVADANVLYFIFYPSFATLSGLGGRLPQSYQVDAYPKWWASVRKAGGQFFTSAAILEELVRLVESAELETAQLMDPNAVREDRFDRKAERYHCAGQLRTIRQTALSILDKVEREVPLLPAFQNATDGWRRGTELWLDSFSDVTDATLAANAKYGSVPHIVSDDCDLITLDGVTVYTANRSAVQAAEAAGKLVSA